MTTTREARTTDRFEVLSADGRRFAVEEVTTFVTVRPLSGPASEHAGMREYRNGRHPVNVNDDGTFEVFIGGRTPVRCRRI